MDKLLKRRRGEALVEYALIIGTIAVLLVASLLALQTVVFPMYGSIVPAL